MGDKEYKGLDIKDAIDFLLCSEFGITLSSSKEKIINATIKKAYKDASSHVLSISNKQKENAQKIIYDAIIEENNKEFDNWHKDLVDKLVAPTEIVSNERTQTNITSGIAQKWINMTIKYLCILKIIYKTHSKKDIENIFNFVIDRGENNFHIPVDGYIIDALKHDNEYNSKDLPKKIDKVKEYKAWSKWSRHDYNSFRSSISTEKFNLKWENKAWILMTEYRKRWEEIKAIENDKEQRKNKKEKLIKEIISKWEHPSDN